MAPAVLEGLEEAGAEGGAEQEGDLETATRAATAQSTTEEAATTMSGLIHMAEVRLLQLSTECLLSPSRRSFYSQRCMGAHLLLP